MKATLALLMSGALVMVLGCSGSSSSGSGGSLGTGGAATGTGGSGGGSAGHEGSAGASGGAGGYGGVLAGGGAGGHGGTIASGGVGGHAGATASGGAGGHAGANGGGGAGGGIACGKNTCPASQYCCSESCGLCAPIGSLCVAIACTDAGVTSDAGACVADPAGDSLCTDSAKPNFHRCVLSTLPPPCVAQNLGNVTNNYCCP